MPASEKPLMSKPSMTRYLRPRIRKPVVISVSFGATRRTAPGASSVEAPVGSPRTSTAFVVGSDGGPGAPSSATVILPSTYNPGPTQTTSRALAIAAVPSAMVGKAVSGVRPSGEPDETNPARTKYLQGRSA